MQVDFALSGSFAVDNVFNAIKDMDGIDPLPHDQDLPELYLVPASDETIVKDTFDVNFRLVDIVALEDISIQHFLGPSWQCINLGESESRGLEMVLRAICKNKEMHGLLLECRQDKMEFLEQGVENPFTGRTPYPLPSPAYLLIYPQIDDERDEQFLAKLCHWPGYHVDSLIVQCTRWASSLPNADGLMDEWDVLSAYDEDISRKEKQFQRPEFFAKPRPKLVPKKRQVIDPRTAPKKTQDVSKSKAVTSASPVPSSSRKATTPNRAANKQTIKKTAEDSWETENKNAMKRRVWDRVMKRGFDKRSQQTKLLFQQIYSSAQYVFRQTIKDEQVDTTTMIQAIEAHLDFYEQMNQLAQGK